jgi:RNA ligase
MEKTLTKTVRVTDLFTHAELDVEIAGGYVKETKHPLYPLVILNYTDKATYDQRWNNVTLHCRGLIVDEDYQNVIARGPRKFFNFGEPSAQKYPLDTPVRISRKEDGSLGIGYYWDVNEDESVYGIATRGSFASDQSNFAMKLIRENKEDKGHYNIFPDAVHDYAAIGKSYIGEFVYPANQVVLDYKGREEVIPLGTVDNRTGLIDWRPWGYTNQSDAVMSLGDALALPIPPGEEGYVLDILEPENHEVIDHLKLKGQWYKEMHAAVFGLTEKRVWEAWHEGREAEFIESLPDELHDWTVKVVVRLDTEYTAVSSRVWKALSDLQALNLTTRKEQAEWILTNHKDISAPLFARLDYNHEKALLWIEKQVMPGHVPFSTATEEGN